MVIDGDDKLEKIVQKAGIYYWEWNSNVGVKIDSFDSMFLVKINLILGQALNNNEDEYEIDYLKKWYKITILIKDINENLMNGVIQDITIYKNQIEENQRQAQIDTLTGFHNRLGLEKIMNLIDFNNNQTAIIFIDLDNFKKLNDIYGHHTGDQMLKSVANSIYKILPKNAHLTRISGDEFIIFIEDNADHNFLSKLATDVLTAIIHSNDKTIIDEANITASMGIATSPLDGKSFEDLIAKADIAMYVAKKHGKAKSLFYSESVHDDYFDYLKVHQFLIKAFKENEFKINYQPIYDLNQRIIEAFEVCPYWIHPTKGLIAYEEFLQILYEEGLIFTFDEWMIEEAIKKIAELKEEGIAIKLSINISPKHLALEHFHKLVAKTLNKYNVEGSSIYIEMVEFILKEDFNLINYNFKKLKELGCKVIIDGFGMNHSTIALLKDLHFDIIKIHKYFVETLFKEFSSEIIINTILKLANQHNKLFIADGVVNEQQFKMLREIHCEYVQGSYLSDPKPLEAIIKIIKRARKE
jgi:diguanylate cyclase (GGDEF)-like protein